MPCLQRRWEGGPIYKVLLPHSIQAWDNDCWSNKVIEKQLDQRQMPPQILNSAAWVVGLALSQKDTSLSAWTVIKGRYHAEPLIVLHGWPIEPMAKWIQWVTSSWNIGTDWSPIVIICRWFRLSHNRPRWWVLPMCRSSSTHAYVCKYIHEYTHSLIYWLMDWSIDRSIDWYVILWLVFGISLEDVKIFYNVKYNNHVEMQAWSRNSSILHIFGEQSTPCIVYSHKCTEMYNDLCA